MGLLLLPVFLYLLVSLPSKPVANVPDEFHYLVKEIDLKQLAQKESIILLNNEGSLSDVVWFNEVFEKFDCYQIMGATSMLNFSKEELKLNGQEFIDLDSVVVSKLNKEVIRFNEDVNAVLVDDHAFLRGVYNLNDNKERERLKTELVILITNQSQCQKKY